MSIAAAGEQTVEAGRMVEGGRASEGGAQVREALRLCELVAEGLPVQQFKDEGEKISDGRR